MNKKDMFLKEKLQQDKAISDRANSIFENLKEEFIMNNHEKKVITISFNKFLTIAASFVLVLFVGTNLYAHSLGKPNIFTAIKNLFNVDKEDYNASEEDINITVESNGVKLTLKTAAMDDNVLIAKYVAEGEKLAKEFYTYQDFEEELIKINKIRFKLAGSNIGTDEFDVYTLKDVTKMRQDFVQKLKELGLTDKEAKELEQTGEEAYKEYVGAQLAHSEYSEEKAKEKIEQVVAIFESKVTSKYEIITSEDKMSGYNIEKVSQTIEKEENKYVIYTIYNVDTLVDILEEFKLNLNVAKIGTIEGDWNYSVNLNKANLNKRVETIEFYENNIVDNVAPNISANDFVKHTATVEAKKLVISDFSTVLMIQTSVKEDGKEMFLKYGDSGLPCIFVVTDEKGNILGTGVCSKDDYEKEILAQGEIKYTDRILLKNVNKDTEKIYVKTYEQYEFDDEKNEVEISIMELDIKAARNKEKPVELIQSYVSKDYQIAFKYPVDWKVTEEKYIKVVGPEDVDGKYAYIIINKVENINNKEIKDLFTLNDDVKILSEGEKTVAGEDGYYKEYTVTNDGNTVKVYDLIFKNSSGYYEIEYSSEIDTQYDRYENVFKKIVETIEHVEPEKSYTVFSNGGYEIIKLYEGNELTVSLKDGAIENLKKLEVIDSVSSDFKEETEYKITGLDEKVANIYISKAAYKECYGMPLIIIRTENEKIYAVNLMKGIEINEFSIEGPFVSGIAEWNVTLQPMKDISDENRKSYIAWLRDYNGREYILRYEDFYKGELFFSEMIFQEEVLDDKTDSSNGNEVRDTEIDSTKKNLSREELYQFLYGDMSWTEGWSVGMKFEYPSNFSLSRLKESYDISNSGECATSLRGSVPARNSNTKEIKDIEIVINIFEPKFVDKVNWEELEKKANITTQTGAKWFLDYSYSVADYDSIVAHKCYQEISSVTGKQYIEYKIEITNLQKDFSIEDLEEKILSSVEFTSF